MAIRFNFQKHIKITNRKALKEFLKGIFESEGIQLGELDYVFCDDPYILNVNQTFLKHNYFTDIITFDISDSPTEVVADIYISAERVRENALKLQVSLSAEVLRVIVHGALHLVGFRDKTSSEKAKMRAAEDKYLKLIG